MVHLISPLRAAPVRAQGTAIVKPRQSDTKTAAKSAPGSATPDFRTLFSRKPAVAVSDCPAQNPSPSIAATSAGTAAAANPPDWRALFTPKPVPAAPEPPPPNPAPTAESLFGPNPWMSNPGGQAPNGVAYSYNPYYFATPATAAKVAEMLGGKVVEINAITPFGPFQQNQPNEMVQLPNGRLIYAGLVAEFYAHGYSQPFIDRLVAAEVTGNPA